MARPKAVNQVRIIGGRHRGRRLSFPDEQGLRPTGDRIRETLFNWLMPMIQGATCLDVFSGSGALGFEAASRGAGRVVMLEQSNSVHRQLQANIELLGLDQVHLIRADALHWLSRPATERFDVVFLDPPFAANLLRTSVDLLLEQDWLAPGGRVYVEYPSREMPVLPASLELLKQQQAGQVGYALLRRIGNGTGVESPKS